MNSIIDPPTDEQIDSLGMWLSENLPIAEEEPTHETRFAIDSDERAEWYLSKLAGLQAEEDRIKEQSARMLSRIKSDRESLTGRFGAEFEAFSREKIAEKKKGKYHDFFNARVTIRNESARLVVESVEDAMTTARLVCPEAIETVEKFNMSAYKDYAQRKMDETGELLPGVTMEAKREVFGIRFPKKGEGEG